MNRGEVWWVNFEPSIGGEIRKKRPVVIISNDASNKYLNRRLQSMWVSKFHSSQPFSENLLNRLISVKNKVINRLYLLFKLFS